MPNREKALEEAPMAAGKAEYWTYLERWVVPIHDPSSIGSAVCYAVGFGRDENGKAMAERRAQRILAALQRPAAETVEAGEDVVRAAQRLCDQMTEDWRAGEGFTGATIGFAHELRYALAALHPLQSAEAAPARQVTHTCPACAQGVAGPYSQSTGAAHTCEKAEAAPSVKAEGLSAEDIERAFGRWEYFTKKNGGIDSSLEPIKRLALYALQHRKPKMPGPDATVEEVCAYMKALGLPITGNGLTAMLEELTPIPTPSAWRSMEDAPKDGTEILVSAPGTWAQGHRAKWTFAHNLHERSYFEGNDEPDAEELAEYNRKAWMSSHCQGEVYGVTAWMPLPPPPTDEVKL